MKDYFLFFKRYIIIPITGVISSKNIAKTMKNCIIGFICVILLSSSSISSLSVYAREDGNGWTSEQISEQRWQNAQDVLWGLCGMVRGGASSTTLEDAVKECFNASEYRDRMTYDEWKNSQLGIDDNGYYYVKNNDMDFVSIVQQAGENYRSQGQYETVEHEVLTYGTSFPVYSIGLNEYTDNLQLMITDPVKFNALKSFVSAHRDSTNYISYCPNNSNIVLYNYDVSTYIVCRDKNYSGHPRAYFYSTSSVHSISNSMLQTYCYNDSSHSFILNTSDTFQNYRDDNFSYADNLTMYFGTYASFFVDSVSTEYTMYETSATTSTVSEQVPRYYQIDNSENYNKVNSDNLQNYITTYYNENNSYPTNEQINTYITNYHPEENNTNINEENNTNINNGGNGGGSGGTSVNGQGVVQSNEQTVNANPIINVIVKIQNSLFGGDNDVDIEHSTDDNPSGNNPSGDNPSGNNPSVTPTPTPTPSGGGSGDNTSQCICSDKCDKDNINSDCPVCSQNYKNCKGKEKSLFDRFKDALGNLVGGIADFLTSVIVDAFKLLVDGIVGVKGEDGHYTGGILGSIRSVFEAAKDFLTNDTQGFFASTLGAVIPTQVWNAISLIFTLIALLIIISFFKK